MKLYDKIKLLILDVDGTMTDGGIYITDQGHQFKKFNARDGIGIKLLMQQGIEVGIISHSLSSEMVNQRANMLGLKYFYIGQRAKSEVLKEWLEKLEITTQEVAYIGDDVNDYDIMTQVGHTACPEDAMDPIKSISRVVLDRKGGEACVREYIDRFLLRH